MSRREDFTNTLFQVPYWTLCEMAPRGPLVLLTGTSCSDRSNHGAALFRDDGHIPVVTANCSAPAAEQLVQCDCERDGGLLMYPGVITGSLRAIDAVRGSGFEQPERAKLRLR